ncbi:MAG: hypothetical protein ACTIJ9_13980 [Aequorivita sp.]
MNDVYIHVSGYNNKTSFKYNSIKQMNHLSYLIPLNEKNAELKFKNLIQQFGNYKRTESEDGTLYILEFETLDQMEQFKDLIKSEIPNLFNL